MTEKEKQILNTFERVFPLLSEREKDNLLSFGDGIYFASTQQAQAGRQEGKDDTSQKGA